MKSSQHGFSAVVIILFMAVLAVAGFVGYRVLSQNNTESQPATQHKEEAGTEIEEDIELQNLGLSSLDDMAIDQQAVREFESMGLKGFYVFGDSLSGGRINPNFEFASVKQGAEVVSAIDGVVGFVREQPDNGDFEVFIQPKHGSAWTIGYDHLIDVAVKQDDVVKAGDLLGYAAPQPNGLLRFELQINKDEGGVTTHYCPSTLLAASVKDQVLTELASMQNAWEQATGFELYDLAAQDPVGCLKATITSTEAEGR